MAGSPPTAALLVELRGLAARAGRSRAWVVCAAWDLTPVEQAAIAARI